MVETKIKSLAGIVTYNPDLIRFVDNISQLKKQISDIVIVDNRSENIDEILEISSKYGAFCIKNTKNLGIAKALSQIMVYARKRCYDWVLTLDQDSVIMPKLVEVYEKAATDIENSNVAMFSCLIHDRNFRDYKNEIQTTKYQDLELCITSAAYTNVEKYFTTKGYDPFFFIDCVDFDICYSLRENNFRICRVNYTGLLHEVGRGENKRFLGKEIVVYHQSALRIYYLARNTILMSRKHRRLMTRFEMLKKLLYQFIRIIAFERPFYEKNLSFIKGIRDAFSPECTKHYR